MQQKPPLNPAWIIRSMSEVEKEVVLIQVEGKVWIWACEEMDNLRKAGLRKVSLLRSAQWSQKSVREREACRVVTCLCVLTIIFCRAWSSIMGSWDVLRHKILHVLRAKLHLAWLRTQGKQSCRKRRAAPRGKVKWDIGVTLRQAEPS